MQVKDQARRLTQLEEMLKEAQLRPVARRRCLESEEDGGASLERQVNSVTQELQVSVQGSFRAASLMAVSSAQPYRCSRTSALHHS